MPRPDDTVEHLIPTDDEVWEQQDEMSAAAWAREIGIAASSVRKWLLRRGWKRDNAGRVTAAPCKVCTISTPVEELNEERVCILHWSDAAYVDALGLEEGTQEHLYKIELRRYLRKNPHYRSGQVVGATWALLKGD